MYREKYYFVSLTIGDHFKAKKAVLFLAECKLYSLYDNLEEILYSIDPSDGRATSIVEWQVFVPLQKEFDSTASLPTLSNAFTDILTSTWQIFFHCRPFQAKKYIWLFVSS